MPDDDERITPIEIATSTTDVTADDLLTDIENETDKDIPFVDLTESE